MCVDSFKFIAADEIIGDFEANGILGLAPGENSELSYIEALYQQGIIDQRIVGLNLENPLDTD